MAAFLIAFVKINDRDRFIAEYGAPTAELVKRFGGEYVARGPGVVAYEGDQFDGASVAISKWPNKAAIDAFYQSDEYQRLIEKRKAISVANIMVVEEPST